MGVLQGHPLADGTEVVAEVERTGSGLDSGEHTRTIKGHAHILSGTATGSVRRWVPDVRGVLKRAASPHARIPGSDPV
ncbi:hypothetical protein GCM10010357_46030 [Streptomyces luteireticuli]|uniref:Uncharacterized protein n=1 Tax=Streptomyces luteireticuli TaxID=173858 RepID=A0ABN0YY87_9ACTN